MFTPRSLSIKLMLQRWTTQTLATWVAHPWLLMEAIGILDQTWCQRSTLPRFLNFNCTTERSDKTMKRNLNWMTMSLLIDQGQRSSWRETITTMMNRKTLKTIAFKATILATFSKYDLLFVLDVLHLIEICLRLWLTVRFASEIWHSHIRSIRHVFSFPNRFLDMDFYLH